MLITVYPDNWRPSSLGVKLFSASALLNERGIYSLGGLLCCQVSFKLAWSVSGWFCVCVCVRFFFFPLLVLCASDTISSQSPQPAATEDFGHLPPEQRRKRLQQKIDDISKELQKELDQRWAVWHTVSLATIAMTTSRSKSTPPLFFSQVYQGLEVIYKSPESLKVQWCKSLKWDVSLITRVSRFVFCFISLLIFLQRGSGEDERCLWEKSPDGRSC